MNTYKTITAILFFALFNNAALRILTSKVAEIQTSKENSEPLVNSKPELHETKNPSVQSPVLDQKLNVSSSKSQKLDNAPVLNKTLDKKVDTELKKETPKPLNVNEAKTKLREHIDAELKKENSEPVTTSEIRDKLDEHVVSEFKKENSEPLTTSEIRDKLDEHIVSEFKNHKDIITIDQDPSNKLENQEKLAKKMDQENDYVVKTDSKVQTEENTDLNELKEDKPEIRSDDDNSIKTISAIVGFVAFVVTLF